MDKKIGLFIKTYSNEKTTDIRIDILEEFFISIKDNVDSNIIKILIIDQCKNNYHREIINKYSNIFNEIIYNKFNKGISSCQNIGIRHLIYKYDIDIGFGCDDDIIIHKNGLNRYAETIIKTNIHHFCYYPYNEYIKMNILNSNLIIQTIYKDNILELNSGISGCFFSFTKEMIENIGYFPKLSYIYGYEHQIFTFNYLKKICSYDIISSNSQISNSEKNIELNIKSIKNTSLSIIDNNKLKINKNEADIYKKNLGQYIPYYDHSEFIQIIIFYEDKNIDNIDNIINDILNSLYLNFIIIIVNENNNNIDKYKDKLYIKIIESNIDNIVNNNHKTYILNSNNTNTNTNIHYINNISEINEFKEKRTIDNFNIIIDKNTNLLYIQQKILKSNKNIYIQIDKKSFNKEINTFVRCMRKGYCYKNSSIKIPNKIKIVYV